jgi:lysophospholipase L1-like esterase
VTDVYQGVPIGLIKTNLLAMYQETVKAKIVPVAATVLPYNTAFESEKTAIHDLNIWISDTAKPLGMQICDTDRAVADPEAPPRLRSSPEALHPDVSGYRALRDALSQTIENHLHIRGVPATPMKESKHD